MSKMDGRRRRYVPVDVELARKTFGTRLIDRWGMAGIGAWVLLLAAAKREDVEGTFSFASELEAWAKLGVEAELFTFTEFLTFCGRNKQTRKTRSGRLTYVEIVNWNAWNTRWRDQQNARTGAENTDTIRTDYRDNAKKYGHDASPEVEAEAEVEEEVEAERPALPMSVDKGLELQRVLDAVRGADSGSWRVLQAAAEGVSLGGIVRVRESCERRSPRPGVGYAVNALKDERTVAA